MPKRNPVTSELLESHVDALGLTVDATEQIAGVSDIAIDLALAVPGSRTEAKTAVGAEFARMIVLAMMDQLLAADELGADRAVRIANKTRQSPNDTLDGEVPAVTMDDMTARQRERLQEAQDAAQDSVIDASRLSEGSVSTAVAS